MWVESMRGRSVTLANYRPSGEKVPRPSSRRWARGRQSRRNRTLVVIPAFGENDDAMKPSARMTKRGYFFSDENTSLNPSGSRNRITRTPHGMSVGSSSNFPPCALIRAAMSSML